MVVFSWGFLTFPGACPSTPAHLTRDRCLTHGTDNTSQHLTCLGTFMRTLSFCLSLLKYNVQPEFSLLEEDKIYRLTLCLGITLNSTFYFKLNLEKIVFKFTENEIWFVYNSSKESGPILPWALRQWSMKQSRMVMDKEFIQIGHSIQTSDQEGIYCLIWTQPGRYPPKREEFKCPLLCAVGQTEQVWENGCLGQRKQLKDCSPGSFCWLSSNISWKNHLYLMFPVPPFSFSSRPIPIRFSPAPLHKPLTMSCSSPVDNSQIHSFDLLAARNQLITCPWMLGC